MTNGNSQDDGQASMDGIIQCFDDISAIMDGFADDMAGRAAELRKVAQNMNELCVQARHVRNQT